MADTERNRQVVLDVFKLLDDKKPNEAAAYFAPDIVEHNPSLGDGAEASRQFFEKMLEQTPELSIEVKRSIAEGDLVALHLHVKESPDDRGMAVVDIFRLEDGKIVEHWDAVQPIPETAANDNTMF